MKKHFMQFECAFAKMHVLKHREDGDGGRKWLVLELGK